MMVHVFRKIRFVQAMWGKKHCLLDYVCLCTVQFLQKIYREDLDEMMDEADFLLNKNRETAKEKVR